MNFHTISRQLEKPWMCEDLRRNYLIQDEKSNRICLRYPFLNSEPDILDFTVKVDEETSKSIVITNLTPVTISYRAEIKNFQGKMKKKKARELAQKLKLLFERFGCEGKEALEKEVYSELTRETGLLIFLSTYKGHIKPHDIQSIFVSVFASVWGLYFDTITLYVDTLEPFYIPLLIEVAGVPVYFTFAPQELNPKLRFEGLRQGDISTRTMYLYNSTFLPLKVVWTVYCMPVEELYPDFIIPFYELSDFGLFIDIHTSDPEEFCKLELIEYLGRQERMTYKIKPEVVYLGPYEKVKVALTVDTRRCWFDENHLETKLKATFLGIVYINRKEGSFENRTLSFRPVGKEIPPLKLEVETYVQIPRLRLLNSSKADATFNVRMASILSNKLMVYQEKRRYLFQNCGLSSGNFCFNVNYPFSITSLKHQRFGLMPSLCYLELHSGEMVEVEILLTVSKTFVENPYILLNFNEPILINLNIVQKNIATQTIQLQINLKNIFFEVSTDRLVFGPTYIGDSRHLTFTLKSPQDESYLIDFERKEDNAFSVSEKKGIVKHNEEKGIQVCFLPRDSCSYLNELRIMTGSLDTEYKIILEGVGSFDYKYHVY